MAENFLLLYWWGGLSLRWVVSLFVLWLLKDLGLWFLLRATFLPPAIGPESLVGARAIAREQLAHDGYVMLGTELWRAESLRSQEVIAPATPVIVRAVRGLTLLVEAEACPDIPEA